LGNFSWLRIGEENLTAEEQLKVIERNVAQIYRREELLEKLKRSLKTGVPLRVKLGIDATGRDIHLGHTVVLRKLRDFQDLGHLAVLIIGDYTALIGDPSERETARPTLTYDQIKENMASYLDQMSQIVDMDKAEVYYNGDWFKKMTFKDVLHLASKMTVARMLEREDFSNRYKKGTPIGLHEFLYPLMQSFDSVMVTADVELGGTEQTFSLMVGRDLQRDVGQEPQVALTMPILVGTDGKKRMGKSLKNYIGITEPPQEMFGKLMSLPDHIMRGYFELLTDKTDEEINGLLSEDFHPREAKVILAKEIVSQFHSPPASEEAAREFDRVFREGKLPAEVPQTEIESKELKDGKMWVVKLLSCAGLVSSNSQARRLISSGAVRIDKKQVKDPEISIPVKEGMVIQVGKKKFSRIALI
jgi:tyrosyl-tRNA synthetase